MRITIERVVAMSKTLSDMELDFFEEFDDQTQVIEWRSDDEEEYETSLAETKAFWHSQHQLLQDALSRRSSTEIRIQRDTEKAMTEIQSAGPNCTCSKECRRNCVLRDIVDRLRNSGCNAALCKSKCRSYPEIPSGEHSYIDVLIESKRNTKKGTGPIRIVIEANFRAEFEMVRGNAEYNRLVSNLPEIFVGKAERLRDVIRIMCGAAKKCMKDNRMHVAPWRKLKYMQSKWLGTCDRIAAGLSFPTAAAAGASERALRAPRASMLTFDLHCPAAAVEAVRIECKQDLC